MRRALEALMIVAAVLGLVAIAPQPAKAQVPVPGINIGRERQELRIPGMPTIDVFAPVGRQAVSFNFSEKMKQARYKWPDPRKRGDDYKRFIRQIGEDWAEPYLTFLSAPEQSDLRIGSGGQTHGAFATFPCDLPWIFYGNLSMAKDIREFWLSPDEGITWIPGVPLGGTGWGAAIPPNLITPGRTYHLLGRYKDKSGREHVAFIFWKLFTRRFGEQWVPLQVHITQSPREDTSGFTPEDWYEYTEGIKPAWAIRRQPAGAPQVTTVPGQRAEEVAPDTEEVDRGGDKQSRRGGVGENPGDFQVREAPKPLRPRGEGGKKVREVPTTGTVRVELLNAEGEPWGEDKRIQLVAYDSEGNERRRWEPVTVGEDSVMAFDDAPLNWFYTVLVARDNRQWVTGAKREGLNEFQLTPDRSFDDKVFPDPEGRGSRKFKVQTWSFDRGDDELVLVLRHKGGRAK